MGNMQKFAEATVYAVDRKELKDCEVQINAYATRGNLSRSRKNIDGRMNAVNPSSMFAEAFAASYL